MSIWKNGTPDPASLTRYDTDTLVTHLGIEVVEATENSLTARMPVDKRTVQPHGRLHGGASVALAETVGWVGVVDGVLGFQGVSPSVRVFA